MHLIGFFLSEKIALAVVAENEGAICLYRELGFKDEGRLKRAFKSSPGGVYHDEVLMAKFV